jgi:hypothetical protein
LVSLQTFIPPLGQRYEIFDAASSRSIGSVPQPVGSGMIGIAPGGRTLVTAKFSPNIDGKFYLWDVPTGTPWLMILALAALPAGLTFWLLRPRAASNS